MIHDASSHAAWSRDAFVVQAPHASDVLSEPLRKAFRKGASDNGLPADMMACLTRLNDVRFSG